MSSILNIHHQRNTQSCSLSTRIVNLHFLAYRAVGERLETIAQSIIEPVSGPIMTCFSLARNFSLVDYCYISSLKVVNKIYTQTFEEPLIKNEIKTKGEQRREKRIEEIQEKLGKETIYVPFCRITASYINDFIPLFLGEQLSALPAFAEGLILFQLGLPIRYLNRQAEKKLNYHAFLLNSDGGKWICGNYDGLKNRVSHWIASKENLAPLISFEHLLLELCLKNAEKPESKQAKNWTAVVLKSLANSIRKEESISSYLAKHTFRSEDEKFIARLHWHKKDGSLPKGLPDPSKVALTIQNLPDELDKALYQRVREVVEDFLLKSLPSFPPKNFSGLFYFLEGQDLLVDILTTLIAELGIKQICDPHLFAIAILQAGGVETTSYELNGFGRKKEEKILAVGQAIMEQACLGASWDKLKEIFEKSELRESPQGIEGIKQQKEIKKKLEEFIAGLIYSVIKDNSLQNQGSLLKALREKASHLPVIGIATVSLHFLINGLFFSFGYLFRDQRMGNTSFLSWMFQNFSGKNLCKFLASKIVELIYHPFWRITLLQAIDTVLEVRAQPYKSLDMDSFTSADFKPITDFLFKYFVKDSDIDFNGNIAPLFDYFTSESIFEKLKYFIKPTKGSLTQNIMVSVLPTIKELQLYAKVVKSFRCQNVCFEGDKKFWEFFIREALQKFIKFHFIGQNPTRTQIAYVRNEYVEKMLAMDTDQLRLFLSDIQKSTMLDQNEWVEVDPNNLVKSCIITKTTNSFEIIEDYRK